DVGVRVGLVLGVNVGVRVAVSVIVGVCVTVADGVAVLVCVAVNVGVAVGVASSGWHCAGQLSPPLRLPSSQVSPVSTAQSPHTDQCAKRCEVVALPLLVKLQPL